MTARAWLPVAPPFLRRNLLLRSGRGVAPVAQGHRVRITAVASVAGNLLLTHGKNAGTWKLLVDLPHEQDHLARDVFARVRVRLLGPPAAMAICAVHVERVAKFTHERFRAMNARLHRHDFQTDAGPLRRGRRAHRVGPVIEFLRWLPLIRR